MRKGIFFLTLHVFLLFSFAAKSYPPLYQEGGNSLYLFGNIAYDLSVSGDSKNIDMKLKDGGTNIGIEGITLVNSDLYLNAYLKVNLSLDYKLFDSLKSIAKIEKVSSAKESSDKTSFISYNSGYLGINHKHYGSFYFGKKAGLYSMYILDSDPFDSKGDIYGSAGIFDGSYSGTGRGDSLVQYIYRTPGKPNKFSFGIQFQLDRADISEIDTSILVSETIKHIDLESDNNDFDDITTFSFSNGYSASISYNFGYKISAALVGNYHTFKNSYGKYKSYIIGAKIAYNNDQDDGYFGSILASYGNNHGRTFHGQSFAPRSYSVNLINGYSLRNFTFYSGLFFTYISGSKSVGLYYTRKDKVTKDGITDDSPLQASLTEGFHYSESGEVYNVSKEGEETFKYFRIPIRKYSFFKFSLGAQYQFTQSFSVFSEIGFSFPLKTNSFSDLTEDEISSIKSDINSSRGFVVGAAYNF